jgi:urea transporter
VTRKEINKDLKENILPGVLNSYAVVFFFNNRLFAVILFAVTCFNFVAGISGLFAVLVAVAIAWLMGFDKAILRQGIYSFNALLIGICIGTFFEPGPVFLVILFLSALLSLILSVALGGWFGKHYLPFLSIPFVITCWIIMLPSSHLQNLGLTQRNVFWMNEVYTIGGKQLLDFFQTIDNLPLSKMVTVYFRSLSSILFQDNLLAGILIAVAILISSRIAFLLSVTGFIMAYVFASFVGADMISFSFYNIGANYILVALAAGGFFSIPSRQSFLWVILLIPLTSLMILFMSKLMAIYQLPVFSLPFSIIIILFVWFLNLRLKPGKPALTQIQHFSPEVNLYTYINNLDRSDISKFFHVYLPFWGEWTVSQGYDGEHTHKGEWSNALDMVLADEEGKNFSNLPEKLESYYCYNKPVVAPADAIVADITDNIDDNFPGKVNTINNWGNTIILKHLNNLYTQLSHLRPGSLRVRKGDFVRKGEIIGNCGNSGRSPVPHLHFQVQTTPLTGAKTISYPFAYYFLKTDKEYRLKSFDIPAEGDIISNISTNPLLRFAFDFQPGMILRFRYRINENADQTATWEIFTDAYNYSYIYCSKSRSAAWFVNDGTMFRFISFNGDRKSLLYYFYLASYKTFLGYYPDIEISDFLPLHIVSRNRWLVWIHDFTAPFHQYLKFRFASHPLWSDVSVNPSKIRIETEIVFSFFSRNKPVSKGIISLSDNKISEFYLTMGNIKVWAQREDIS